MTDTEILSKIDKVARPLITMIPGDFAVRFYSSNKDVFLKRLVKQKADDINLPDSSHRVRLWGLNFACPLFNSAGMFKKGDGYYAIAAQGAGAFLVGTTTSIARNGNIKNGIKHPFVPLPQSNVSINWMGLPNEGHLAVAKRISTITKQQFTPLGASLSATPEHFGKEALDGLLAGLVAYNDANVDFIEINESCPNVPHETGDKGRSGIDQSLIDRLEFISTNFLKKRNRNLPVIVKLSNDTDKNQVPALIDILLELKFDGVNFGNTSTRYDYYENKISDNEKSLFRLFTREYGGGMSGTILKESSLELAKAASQYLENKQSEQEFHIIRTGGIDTPIDVLNSELAGIKLNQWYTGYFKNYASYGNKIYKMFFDEINRLKK